MCHNLDSLLWVTGRRWLWQGFYFWDSHWVSNVKKACACIGALRRIKPFVPLYTLVTLYNLTLITVRRYGIYLWKATWKINCKNSKPCGKVITGLSYDIRSVDVLDNLKWRNLETRRSHMHVKATLMYKNLIDQWFCPPSESLLYQTQRK